MAEQGRKKSVGAAQPIRNLQQTTLAICLHWCRNAIGNTPMFSEENRLLCAIYDDLTQQEGVQKLLGINTGENDLFCEDFSDSLSRMNIR